MIFSHVLYQLSYLALPQKNPPEPSSRRGRKIVGGPTYRLSAPARIRGLHVSATVQERAREASRAPSANQARQLED